MLLPTDMKFAARKVHFLQKEGPKFERVGNFTVPLSCVQAYNFVTIIVTKPCTCLKSPLKCTTYMVQERNGLELFCSHLCLWNNCVTFLCFVDVVFLKTGLMKKPYTLAY